MVDLLLLPSFRSDVGPIDVLPIAIPIHLVALAVLGLSIWLIARLPKRGSGIRVSAWRYVGIAFLLLLGLAMSTCCALFWIGSVD